MARTGPPGMSAQWSLSVGKRTWLGLPISVAIDPSPTFDPSPFQAFCTFRSPGLSARSHRQNEDELAAVNLHGPGKRVTETAQEID